MVPQAPPWSFTNIKCVAANIMHVVAEIMCHVAIIQCCMASILSKVPDILHLQHHFFEIFEVFLAFQKCSKIGLL